MEQRSFSAGVAQLVEQLIRNQQATSAILVASFLAYKIKNNSFSIGNVGSVCAIITRMCYLRLPLMFLFMFSFAVSQAHAGNSRLESIAKALDAIDKKIDKAFDSFERTDTSKIQQLGARKTHTFDAGFETYYYQYWESIPIKVTGTMNGYYLNYVLRPPDGNFFNNVVSNVYSLEGRYAAGQAEYNGYSGGTLKNDKNYNWEIRGIIGKEFLVNNDIVITPYGGVGFRYLYNPGNGKRTSIGLYGYDRRSYYYYLPVGFNFEMPHLYGNWSTKFNAEYDIFLRGVQVSDLNEVTPYVGYEYPNISNRQGQGFGVRSSFKFMYSTPRVDFYFEPFIRYWNIQDSDIKEDINHSGQRSAWQEPHNTTKEIGSKFGLQF